MTNLRFLRFMAGSIVVFGFGLLGMLIATTVSAQGDPGGTVEQRDDCGQCHLDVVVDWQDSTHAKAFADDYFQMAWREQDRDPQCLRCHTTGFVPRTGAYEHPGVTCEACHGTVPADHPPEPVAIDPGVDTCESCHAMTFTEWEQSGHGEADIPCTECHVPHPQQLRAESSTALCAGCHEVEMQEQYIHDIHTEQQECADCHWFRRDVNVDSEHVMSGALVPTGHGNEVGTRACVNCHQDLEGGEVVLAAVEGTTPLFDAQVHVAELEAELGTLETQSENTEVLRLTQGLVLGMIVGGAFVLLIARSRTTTKEASADE